MNILNSKVDINYSKKEVFKKISNVIQLNKIGEYICTTNAEFLVDAFHDKEFNNIINNSLYSIPDGSGVVIASEFVKNTQNKKTNFKKILVFITCIYNFITDKSLQQKRYPGVDLMYDMCRLAEEKNYTVFILGGWPKNSKGQKLNVNYDLATKTANELRLKYPKLNIVGATSKFSYKKIDDKDTIEYINSCMKNSNVSNINMIFVAYNHINQEKWLVRNMGKIRANIGVGVGGSLDFISGNVKRAPQFIQRLGIEWLYRLLIEPWRIKRIYKATIYFIFLLFKTY